MLDHDAPEKLLTVTSLREFFRDSLHAALVHQRIDVEDQTEHYVVNLLTLFARSEALYERTADGMRLKPLVLLMSEALEAPSTEGRSRGLQKLGDVSLFIAGFFAQGFARKIIDIDYHIAMGGRAYSALAALLARGRSRVLGQVFAELAEKFQPMVDALHEVRETSHRHSDEDVLRLYELWIKTGSQRAYRLLRELGVDPSASARGALAH